MCFVHTHCILYYICSNKRKNVQKNNKYTHVTTLHKDKNKCPNKHNANLNSNSTNRNKQGTTKNNEWNTHKKNIKAKLCCCCFVLILYIVFDCCYFVFYIVVWVFLLLLLLFDVFELFASLLAVPECFFSCCFVCLLLFLRQWLWFLNICVSLKTGSPQKVVMHRHHYLWRFRGMHKTQLSTMNWYEFGAKPIKGKTYTMIWACTQHDYLRRFRGIHKTYLFRTNIHLWTQNRLKT